MCPSCKPRPEKFVAVEDASTKHNHKKNKNSSSNNNQKHFFQAHVFLEFGVSNETPRVELPCGRAELDLVQLGQGLVADQVVSLPYLKYFPEANNDGFHIIPGCRNRNTMRNGRGGTNPSNCGPTDQRFERPQKQTDHETNAQAPTSLKKQFNKLKYYPIEQICSGGRVCSCLQARNVFPDNQKLKTNNPNKKTVVVSASPYTPTRSYPIPSLPPSLYWGCSRVLGVSEGWYQHC